MNDKEKAVAVLRKVRTGSLLTSTPEKWWDYLNPFVVKLDGDVVPADVCHYLCRQRLVKTDRNIDGVRHLALTAKGFRLLEVPSE